MSYTVEQVTSILQKVIHPSSGKDIVSMNLVKNLVVDNSKVSFVLSFASVNDPMKNSLKKACEKFLLDIPGISEVDIKVETQLKPVSVKPEPEPVLTGVKYLVAIASGKGGVGKSTIAANIAVAFANSGARVGLIDADIYGPSIPKMFGVENEKPDVIKKNGRDVIVPVEKNGVKLLSIGFFVSQDDATIWRGPMASNALSQLISDGDWGTLDYLFVDLPPGTSDIHITISQNKKLTGAVIVSTPQDVALADVKKGISMFQNKAIGVPVLGLIENMAWFTPDELPESKYYIFGKGGCEALANEKNVPFLGHIPIVQSIREDADNGVPTAGRKNKTSEYFKHIAEKIRIEILRIDTVV
ncbi:MAG: Mrp/NBP35 family ATP-binding protein [Bacteroidota bacterium]|nr:MAG: Mrp/NBP35 family ATP-binding protein [Bacteroidota bacterium]